MLIRDDGSKDKTVQIIQDIMKRDKRVSLIENKENVHGAYHNFHELIIIGKTMPAYDYYLFSDQDDLWVHDKIEKMVKFIRNKEKDKPVLVYSDLAIIDNKDKLTNSSINAYAGIDLTGCELNAFFIHAYIWGCAVIVNQKLFETIPVIKANCKQRNTISHDNYMAKYAIIFGKLYFLNEPLVRHRIHDANVTQPPKAKMNLAEIMKRGTIGLSTIAEKHGKVYAQTLFAVRHFQENGLKNRTLDEIERVITVGGCTGVTFFIKHKIKRKQLSKTIGLYLIMLTKKYMNYLA